MKAILLLASLAATVIRLSDPKGVVRFEGLPHYLNERNLASLLDKYGG